MVKKDFRLSASDFIPVAGLYKYLKRNKDRNERYNVDQLVSYIKNETALKIFNVSLFFGTLIGLEALVNK